MFISQCLLPFPISFGFAIRAVFFLAVLVYNLGLEAPKRKISYPMAITMARFAQLVSALNHKPPRIPMTTARSIGIYAYYDYSKAVKELGLPQPPIRSAFEKAVNWFRENGYIHADSKTSVR
jgi:hypothetical protein